MRAKHWWTALLLGFASPAVTADAQSVAGRVLAATDRQPITHALIVVLDDAGRERGGVLSDSAGQFVLRVPAPGRYTIRVERIGYESVTSEPLPLGSGLHPYDVVLSERPLALESVRAQAGGRGCAARRDGAAVHQLWEEIQKALRLSMFTDTRPTLSYATMLYERETDAQLTKVQREQQTYRHGRAMAPFGAIAPAELLTKGFSRADGEETVLFGLDAGVLLSREFLDHYCFRIERSAQQNLIGLAFEPIRRRNETDVRGALWVDRQSAELRYLAYQFVNLPAHVAAHGSTAEAHFRRLSTGLWVIERWWIRTPRVAIAGSQRRFAGRTGYELLGYREDGGVLLAAADGASSTYELIGGAAITGRVTGRSGADARGRARVFLSGTPHVATADDAGMYRMVGVPAGTYVVAARDSLLDDLRMPVRLATVQLVTGQTAVHDITWPTRREILRALCPGDEEDTVAQNRSLVYGDVMQPETGQPLAGAEVRVDWRVPVASENLKRWRVATTAEDGRYYLCWIPDNTELSVSVTAPELATRRLQLYLSSPIKRLDVR